MHSPTEASSNPQHPGHANGRPKGSSKTQKKAMEVNEQKCLDKILTEYRKALAESKSADKNVMYGFLQKILNKEKRSLV